MIEIERERERAGGGALVLSRSKKEKEVKVVGKRMARGCIYSERTERCSQYRPENSSYSGIFRSPPLSRGLALFISLSVLVKLARLYDAAFSALLLRPLAFSFVSCGPSI